MNNSRILSIRPQVEVAPSGSAKPTDVMRTQSVERKVTADGNAVESEIVDSSEAAHSQSSDTAEPVEKKAQAPGSASNAIFTPTQDWLDAVKGELPLNTIMRLIKYLGPQLEEISSSDSAVDEQKVVDFIQVALYFFLI